MAVLTVRSDTFTQEVLQSDLPVLVDFYADWCGPCKMLAPIVERAAEKAQGVKVCRVNVDEAPNVAARYGISGIPTLIVFRGGQNVKQSVGLIGEADVLELVK